MGLLHEGSWSYPFFLLPQSSGCFKLLTLIYTDIPVMGVLLNELNVLICSNKEKTALLSLLNNFGKCSQWLWVLCSASRKTGWLCAEENIFLPGQLVYIPTSAFFLVSNLASNVSLRSHAFLIFGILHIKERYNLFSHAYYMKALRSTPHTRFHLLNCVL